MDSALITIEELAEILKVPKSYVYRMNYLNKLPGKVILGPRTVRYVEAEIINWINDLKT